MSNGHFKADLDPLKMEEAFGEEISSKYNIETHNFKKTLDPRYYGFTEADMDKEFIIDLPNWGGLLSR